MKLKTLVSAWFIGNLIGVLVSLATTGAIVYIALHFVLKFW